MSLFVFYLFISNYFCIILLYYFHIYLLLVFLFYFFFFFFFFYFLYCFSFFFFFFQAEDGIRDKLVTGVQTCALPISFEDAAQADRNDTRVGHAVARALRLAGQHPGARERAAARDHPVARFDPDARRRVDAGAATAPGRGARHARRRRAPTYPGHSRNGPLANRGGRRRGQAAGHEPEHASEPDGEAGHRAAALSHRGVPGSPISCAKAG